MNTIVKDFFAQSKMDASSDAAAIMEFLTQPQSINKMLVMTDLGLPALTGVVKELEEKFADSETFPLKRTEETSNATNRQNVGRMVKYIMREFGCYPISSALAERTRLRDFAGAKYFSTAAVYERVSMNPHFRVTVDTNPKL